MIFVAFEAGMPLIGLGVGDGLACVIGGIADYVAAAAAPGLGIYLLVHDDSVQEEKSRRARRYPTHWRSSA